MAHVVVEVTANLARGLDAEGLLQDLHAAIDGIAALRGEDLKGRLRVLDDFMVGLESDEADGFVAAEVQTFAGKSEAEREATIEAVLDVLAKWLSPELQPGRVDVSVRVTELDRTNYGRRRSVGLGPQHHAGRAGSIGGDLGR